MPVQAANIHRTVNAEVVLKSDRNKNAALCTDQKIGDV
jgi:hypothetical protein